MLSKARDCGEMKVGESDARCDGLLLLDPKGFEVGLEPWLSIGVDH